MPIMCGGLEQEQGHKYTEYDTPCKAQQTTAPRDSHLLTRALDETSLTVQDIGKQIVEKIGFSAPFHALALRLEMKFAANTGEKPTLLLRTAEEQAPPPRCV